MGEQMGQQEENTAVEIQKDPHFHTSQMNRWRLILGGYSKEKLSFGEGTAGLPESVNYFPVPQWRYWSAMHWMFME